MSVVNLQGSSILLTKNIHDVVHIVHLVASLDQRQDLFDRSLDGLRDLINILRLDNSLQIIFKNLREVVYTY